MSHFSRRSFLKSAAVAAGSGMAVPVARALDLHVPSSTSGQIVPFPLSRVRLAPGIFREQEEINARYLDSLAVNRLLYSFQATAGIASNATPYKGWEAPTCELRGHFNGGHFLSAVALASAASANADLKAKGDQLVAGLAQCQKKIGTGYLSAFPTDLFEHLTEGKQVWAPFYTYHKIMAGLLDMYVLTGNTDALEIAEGMGRWAGDYFWGISTEQRLRMLREEYGGMNEVLVNLAALTKKDRYLETARLFEQPSILLPLAERRDDLEGMHANTNVPKIIGAARMYEVTGDLRYRQIAEYFLDEVVTARNYVIGNSSVDEFWKTAPGQLQGTLAWRNAECCVAYNMMKLERLVFSWTGDARWMDEYERALFNCRLGTQNAEGLKQYFFPRASGYWRAFNSPEASFFCCTGTGAEEFAKFNDTIYYHRGGDLYVNQFLASTLDWEEEALVVKQVTQFPREQGTTLKIESSRPVPRTIHLRIPGWTTASAQIKVNGQPLEAMADPGSYLALRRVWQKGDTISLTLPMELQREPLQGDATVNAALYGPLVLAANVGSTLPAGQSRTLQGDPYFKNLPAPNSLTKIAADTNAKTDEWVETESAAELRFSVRGEGTKYELKPAYQIADERYGIYWQLRSEAKET